MGLTNVAARTISLFAGVGAVKVLIACEYSGKVRDAFIKRGHKAISCDFLPSDRPGPHCRGDVRQILNCQWDLLIAFPPCTHLCSSGARWFRDKLPEQAEAVEFVKALMSANIPKIAIENPIGVLSSKVRKPDQIVQPWMFGHGETKATCLWLKGLPLLQPTEVVPGREARIHKMAPSPDRWKRRSETYSGIAEAMAEQWGHA